MQKRPASLTLAVTGPAAETLFDGTLALNEAPQLDGTLRVKAPSAGRLAASLRGDDGEMDSAPVAFEGLITATPKAASISEATLNVAGTVATGSLSVEKRDRRPFWRSDLKIAELDLNRLREALEPAASASPAQPASSIGELLERDGPQVKGYTKRDGWSEEPFDVAMIGTVDGEFRLAIGHLQHNEIKAGPLLVVTSVESGRLTSTLSEAELYGGRAQGDVTIDATGETPIITATFSGGDLNGRAFLRDAAALDWLAGSTELKISLTGQGGTEKELIETLGGTVSAHVRDGAIVGINIPKAIRDLGDGKLSGPAPSPDQKTDFADLSASFAIKDGVAESKDLVATSPLLRVAGSGKVHLREREIDCIVRPRLVASLEGQGGEQKLAGVEIPVRIRGNWEKPSFSPHLGSLITNPGGAVEVVKEIGKKLKGKGVSDVLRGFFGSEKQDGEVRSEDEKKGAKSRKLLDQFLGQDER